MADNKTGTYVAKRKKYPKVEHCCGVKNCDNNSNNTSNLAFFPIPTMSANPERRRLWLQIIGRGEIVDDVYRYLEVCENHFANKYIHHSTTKQLTNDAIPTLNLTPQKTEQEEAMNKGEPNEQNAINSTKTGINKTKQLEEMPRLNINTTENNILKDATAGIDVQYSQQSFVYDSHLSNPLNSLMKIYRKLKEENKESNLYTEEFKKVAVRIYQENFRIYEILQNPLGLPSASDILTFIPSKPEVINEIFINTLKAKVNLMSHNQVNCTLCVSLISIKPKLDYDVQSDTVIGFSEIINAGNQNSIPPAKYALVAMVRGLIDEWQQILTFSFLANISKQCDFNLTFGIWLEKVISNLLEIGLNLKVVISDTNNFLINAFMQMISAEEPFLSINGKKIFCIFDAPGLLMLIYDNLSKDDFVINKFVNWDHILKFYKIDRARKFKLAPKLTEDHFNLVPKQSLKNKMLNVAEVLSLDTAAGISTYIELGLLSSEAKETAIFIKQINKLIDTPDSNWLKSNYKHVFFSSSLFDKQFSMSMIYFFQGLNFYKNSDIIIDRNVHFVDCCVVTLKNLRLLREDFDAENKLTLVTRYLNQVPLIELLDKVFMKNGECKDPTARELIEIMKASLVDQHFEVKKECSSNSDMGKFTELATQLIELESKHQKESGLQMDSYKDLKFDGADTLVYVAMFLIDKIYQTTHCLETKRKILDSRMFYEKKTDNKVKKFAIVPNDCFVLFVKKLDEIFVKTFKRTMTSANVVVTFMNIFKSIKSPKALAHLAEDDIHNIKRWFIMIRIINTIKYTNKHLEEDEKQSFSLNPLIQ